MIKIHVLFYQKKDKFYVLSHGFNRI